MSNYLRKIILISVITGSVFFGLAILFGIKQTLLLKHCEKVLLKSTELSFRISNLHEQLTSAIFFKKKEDFQQIISELQSLSPLVTEISNDLVLPLDIKSICIAHSDISSLIMLLHSYNDAIISPENIVKIHAKTRELTEKTEQFNMELRNYIIKINKTNSFIVIGLLLAASTMITIVLLYMHKKIVLPLASLLDEIAHKRFSGDYSKLNRPKNGQLFFMITDYFNNFVNLYVYEKELQASIDKRNIIKCCSYAVTGEIASEISHDIIDRANGMMNYAEVIRGELEPMESQLLIESIDKIQDSGQLIADYASQILYTACNEELCEQVKIRDILGKILKVLSRRMRHEQIEVIQECTNDFLMRQMHLHIMTVVLLSILLTAFEDIGAVRFSDKRKITFRGDIKNHNVIIKIIYPKADISQENGKKLAAIQRTSERLHVLTMFLEEKGGSVELTHISDNIFCIKVSLPVSI